jgi:hypothetical protein
MAEYCLGIYRLYEKFPRQVLLYVGDDPIRMEDKLEGSEVSFRYRIVDIRSLDGEALLASGEVGDNVIAILAKLRDHKEAVHRIVTRIARLQGSQRSEAFGKLMLLAGLRSLEEATEKEARRMPLLNDILDNKVFRREYLRGREEEREESRQRELRILRSLIKTRFGKIPVWAEKRLTSLSNDELVDVGERVPETHSLKELLPK